MSRRQYFVRAFRQGRAPHLSCRGESLRDPSSWRQVNDSVPIGSPPKSKNVAVAHCTFSSSAHIQFQAFRIYTPCSSLDPPTFALSTLCHELYPHGPQAPGFFVRTRSRLLGTRRYTCVGLEEEAEKARLIPCKPKSGSPSRGSTKYAKETG